MNNIHTEIEERTIEEAIKDGVANHTGEWFNGFIAPGLNLTPEQSEDLLLFLTKAKRLKNNIKALLLDAQAEGYKRGYIEGSIAEFNEKNVQAMIDNRKDEAEAELNKENKE
jgi:hypothetical protein